MTLSLLSLLVLPIFATPPTTPAGPSIQVWVSRWAYNARAALGAFLNKNMWPQMDTVAPNIGPVQFSAAAMTVELVAAAPNTVLVPVPSGSVRKGGDKV